LQHRVNQFLDASDRMFLRHPLLNIEHHQHRPLPPFLTAHPPLSSSTAITHFELYEDDIQMFLNTLLVLCPINNLFNR
jgi:hypothetical protein